MLHAVTCCASVIPLLTCVCCCCFRCCRCRQYSPLPLVHVLRGLVTRHTKEQQLDGQAVLSLPAKTLLDVPGEVE